MCLEAALGPPVKQHYRQRFGDAQGPKSHLLQLGTVAEPLTYPAPTINKVNGRGRPHKQLPLAAAAIRDALLEKYADGVRP